MCVVCEKMEQTQPGKRVLEGRAEVAALNRPVGAKEVRKGFRR